MYFCARLHRKYTNACDDLHELRWISWGQHHAAVSRREIAFQLCCHVSPESPIGLSDALEEPWPRRTKTAGPVFF